MVGPRMRMELCTFRMASSRTMIGDKLRGIIVRCVDDENLPPAPAAAVADDGDGDDASAVGGDSDDESEADVDMTGIVKETRTCHWVSASSATVLPSFIFIFKTC